jgi:hypothetical protein
MRPPGRVQLNIAVDAEVVELIKSMAASRRGYGDLVSRLIFEERARSEERQRLRKQIAAVVGSESHAA